MEKKELPRPLPLELANDIVNELADADMVGEELRELFLQNGIEDWAIDRLMAYFGR